MLNTRDLEQRWLRYKIKFYIPHFIIFISIIIISVIILTFFNSDKKDIKKLPEEINKTQRETQTNKEITIKTPKVALIKKSIEVKSIDYNESLVITPKIQEKEPSNISNNSLKLAPSLDFMKNMQHAHLPYYKEEPIIENQSVSAIVEETQKPEPVEKIQEAVVAEEEIKKIRIKRRDASKDIRDIIKRFKKNNNPALSLFVAKKYYELGEYHKAYNYALITNQINRDIDESWIIFTKSLVKLKQKKMAIKTLNEYLKSSHSSSAKILLDEIISGKFK